VCVSRRREAGLNSIEEDSLELLGLVDALSGSPQSEKESVHAS
jgi:hypothetical protein